MWVHWVSHFFDSHCRCEFDWSNKPNGAMFIISTVKSVGDGSTVPATTQLHSCTAACMANSFSMPGSGSGAAFLTHTSDPSNNQNCLRSRATSILTTSRMRSTAYIDYEWQKGLCSRLLCSVQTYRALHGDAPQYLRQFTSVADIPTRQRLRSSTSDDLRVPAVRLPTVGRHAFSVAGARVWNALPADVTSAPSLFTFRKRLKLHLFPLSHPGLVL